MEKAASCPAALKEKRLAERCPYRHSFPPGGDNDKVPRTAEPCFISYLKMDPTPRKGRSARQSGYVSLDSPGCTPRRVPQGQRRKRMTGPNTFSNIQAGNPLLVSSAIFVIKKCSLVGANANIRGKQEYITNFPTCQ